MSHERAFSWRFGQFLLRVDEMEQPQPPAAAPAPPQQPTTITYDDFAKIALRVATVVEAQAIEKSKKLIKMQVDLGNGERRQILAGIKEHYAPEQLIGRQIIVVANLA